MEIVAENVYPFTQILENGDVAVETRNSKDKEEFCDLLALYEIPIAGMEKQTDTAQTFELTAEGMFRAKDIDFADEADLLISPSELKSRLLELQLAEDENIL